MTFLGVIAAIWLYICDGRYWAPTNRTVCLSQIRLPARFVRPVASARSRRREVPVMTPPAVSDDDDPSPPVAPLPSLPRVELPSATGGAEA